MYRRWGKRFLDLLLASISLVILSPLLLVVALAILLDGGTPVVFRQKRIGCCGKQFELLKFRSMPVGTQNAPSAEVGAVKITRVGRVIRRLNIDELLQLVNIVRGQMSVVGPRPALATQKRLIQLRRESGALECLPGLTGLAQIKAYDGMHEAEKAGWDAKYATEITFLGDVVIILKTFGYIFRRPPVY